MALTSKMWGCGWDSIASAWGPMVGFCFIRNCETERLSASPWVRWGHCVPLKLQRCHDTERHSLNAVPVFNYTSWHEWCMVEWRYGSKVPKCKYSNEMYGNVQCTIWSLQLIWIDLIERGVVNRTYTVCYPVYCVAHFDLSPYQIPHA